MNADLPDNESLLRDFDVMSLPTFVLVDPDGRRLGFAVGSASEDTMRTWIKESING